MLENETSEDPKPTSKPPYLFLIPVALGVVGFIGYQTVRMGTETSVARSPYAIDTSVAQAVVQNGVITVHAERGSAPHVKHERVQHLAMHDEHAKPQASPTPEASSPPSTAPSASPGPEASPTKAAEETAAKAGAHAHEKSRSARDRGSADGDEIAADPVPQIERPIANHVVASAVQSSGDAATAPPITDAPIVQHQSAAQAVTAAPVALATAKPVQVAQAPAEAPGPINAADRIVDAKMRYAAAPEYPDMARDQGVRGTSVVLVTVDPKGAIVRMSIASSSGNGSLDRAALSAARSSQYVAPKVDGKPAIETYRVTYDFAP